MTEKASEPNYCDPKQVIHSKRANTKKTKCGLLMQGGWRQVDEPVNCQGCKAMEPTRPRV